MDNEPLNINIQTEVTGCAARMQPGYLLDLRLPLAVRGTNAELVMPLVGLPIVAPQMPHQRRDSLLNGGLSPRAVIHRDFDFGDSSRPAEGDPTDWHDTLGCL